MVKWAVAHESVAAPVYDALKTAEGFAKGRSAARQNTPVEPAPLRDLLAAFRRLPPALRDMVRFQYWTACRPGEACALRPGDLTRDRGLWVYVPGSHKTEHHGELRRIPVGRKARKAITRYLDP